MSYLVCTLTLWMAAGLCVPTRPVTTYIPPNEPLLTIEMAAGVQR